MLWKIDENRSERDALAATTPTNSKTVPWWRDSGLRPLNFGLFFLMFSEFTQGYDASLINNVQQLTRWESDFGHPSGSLLGALSAAYWIGNVAGVVFIAGISDRFGRRISLIFGSVLCITGVAICTAVVNDGVFVAGRILLGMGGVVVGAIGPVFISELAYPAHRTTATAISNTTYSAGSILAAWVTFGSFKLKSTWAWRTPTVIQALPSIAIIIGALVLPESPRWLVSRGKEDQARSILIKYHAAGYDNDEVVNYEFEEIRQTIELEMASKKTSWKTLFATRGNRWRSLILIWCGVCKQWSGNGLISYYLGSMLKSAGITKTIDTTLITATSQIFSFACSLAFAFLPARVGRRTLMLWSMGLMWLVFSVITATTGTYVETGSRHAGNATVAFIYLYSGVHNIGWTGAMIVYVVEILPYGLRAKGMALFWLLTGACGAFNTYVNPLGMDAFGWKFYFFYVAWIIVEFVVIYVFFIETKGPSLEQVALLFDGKDANIGRVSPVAEEYLDSKEKEIEAHEGRVEQQQVENGKTKSG
ncbi:Lactose permease [Cytospora mali]|uniref:Lactose permease n=1 Tax=Cytospora mali TaxID=578113 RepID=A0A194VI33_CYTMA|nr:Lactose permease [Valsa mali]